jgi:spore germination cell wall hydrolase CwlJ-like protein
LRALLLALVLSVSVTSHATTHDNICLATAIYYEAGAEPLEGKRAVADTIINRAEAYGMTICQVVKQRGQFSWVGLKPMRKYNTAMRELLTEVNEVPTILSNDYLYFFNKRLRPKWARHMKCRVISNQKFCRTKERHDGI